jgi:peroxiredoxin Q/BCP
MAQLRQDYAQFVDRDAEILAVGPESRKAFAAYWQPDPQQEARVPFVGLPDPDHVVLDLYGQEVKWLKLGRLPAQIVVDKGGKIRYAHYGRSMADIPPNGELLALLEELNQEGAS